MRYLPISYDTKDKNLLILGGGLLALSKIKQMLNTKFKIYVIAESFVNEISNLQEQHPEQLFLKEMKIDNNFVFFAYDFLLIATTNFELNNAIEERALKTGILYERCDVISSSSVLLNELVSKEDIIIGISNEKLNPTIVEIIKDDLTKLLDTYNMDKIKILNKIRTELVRKNASNVDETIKKLFVEEKIKAEDYLNTLQEDIAKDEVKDNLEKDTSFEESYESVTEFSAEDGKEEILDLEKSFDKETVEETLADNEFKLDKVEYGFQKVEIGDDLDFHFERKHKDYANDEFPFKNSEDTVEKENFKEEEKSQNNFQNKFKSSLNKISKPDFFRKK